MMNTTNRGNIIKHFVFNKKGISTETCFTRYRYRNIILILTNSNYLFITTLLLARLHFSNRSQIVTLKSL